MTEATATMTTASSSAPDEHADFIQQFDQPHQNAQTVDLASTASSPSAEIAPVKLLYPLRTSEVVIGVSTICLWLCFFLAGIVVGTKPYRELISNGGVDSILEMLGVWTILMTCYTVTNIAILSCLAAIIGKFSRRSLTYESAALHGLASAPVAKFGEVMVFYSVAIARGFVIYLMLTGGLILLTTSAVTESSPEEYIKLAGTVSILAFMAGYDAEVFKRALDRISTFSSEGKSKP